MLIYPVGLGHILVDWWLLNVTLYSFPLQISAPRAYIIAHFLDFRLIFGEISGDAFFFLLRFGVRGSGLGRGFVVSRLRRGHGRAARPVVASG